MPWWSTFTLVHYNSKLYETQEESLYLVAPSTCYTEKKWSAVALVKQKTWLLGLHIPSKSKLENFTELAHINSSCWTKVIYILIPIAKSAYINPSFSFEDYDVYILIRTIFDLHI